TALQNAMMTVPRAKPENVYQPTPPAVCQRCRAPIGSCLRNHSHIAPPRARKNTEQKVSREMTMNTIATEPNCEAAVDAIVELFSWSHCRPFCHQWSMSSDVTVHGNGPSSRNEMFEPMPSENWSARSSH